MKPRSSKPRGSAASTKRNPVKAGRNRSKAGPARPAEKAASKPSAKRKVSAKGARPSPASRAKTSRRAAAPGKRDNAKRQKNTGAKPGQPRDVPASPTPAPANMAKPQDPAEVDAMLENQRKAARAPMMPVKSAPKPMPPQSGKPIWAQPHSS